MKKFVSTVLLTGLTLIAFSNPTFADSVKEKAKMSHMKMQRIDLNTASIDQLVTLPGIGKKKAVAIIEYRKKNGKFKSIQNLTDVKGIGSKMLEKLKGQLVVS